MLDKLDAKYLPGPGWIEKVDPPILDPKTGVIIVYIPRLSGVYILFLSSRAWDKTYMYF